MFDEAARRFGELRRDITSRVSPMAVFAIVFDKECQCMRSSPKDGDTYGNNECVPA